jgi:hypothetical protein
MSNSLRRSLSGLTSAFPSALSPYWRALPIRRMKLFLAGTFLIAVASGFCFDLLLLNFLSLGRGLFWPVLIGISSTVLLVTIIKKARLVPVLFVLVVGLFWLGYRAAHGSAPFPVQEALHRRVVFDAIGTLLAVGFGFRLLTLFAGTEGLAHIRMQTELSLAHGIQATLVPTVSFQNAGFEVYGKSIPSTEMGGDLIDVIASDGSLLVYVADVSGHGLAAGQLMGMLKTAMRLAVQFRQTPVALLESADRVLPGLKGPDMYATLALLHFDGSAEVEYSSAGHVPILHYRNRTRDTASLSMEQFPLGLIPGARYASQRVMYSSRDLFLLLTDGISEVPNARDEDFGLTRLAQLLTQHAAQPLPQIWDLIMTEVRKHGVQQDDQTLLLIRVIR